MRGNCLFLMGLLLVGYPAMGDGVAKRDVIVSRMNQFLDITLQTNTQMEDECLTLNLEHPNYQTVCCSGWPPYEMHCSDILWHEHFLNGIPGYIGWSGMPYSYGGGYTPDHDVQGAIDGCKGLGNHTCHYTCMGCAWAVGVDCSAAVSWALGIPREGTWNLGSTACGVEITDWDNVKNASYICKPGAHVVLVESRDGNWLTILEATGDYPVARWDTHLWTFYRDLGYTPWDAKAVADAEGSDGILLAEADGEGVELTWRVESAGRPRYYEFQCWDEVAGYWVTIAEGDFCGPGDYVARYSTPDAASLIYRVLENEWSGVRIAHGETVAYPAQGR
jgi:hypothetical protein